VGEESKQESREQKKEEIFNLRGPESRNLDKKKKTGVYTCEGKTAQRKHERDQERAGAEK